MSITPELMHNLLSVQPLKWYNLFNALKAFHELNECINSHGIPNSIVAVLATLGSFLFIVFSIGGFFGILFVGFTRFSPVKHVFISLLFCLSMVFLGGTIEVYTDNAYVSKGKQILQDNDIQSYKFDMLFYLKPVTQEAQKLLAAKTEDMKIISYNENFIYMEPIYPQGNHAVFSISKRNFLFKVGYSYTDNEEISSNISKPMSDEMREREKGFENSHKME